jgi:hypothetical protein
VRHGLVVHVEQAVELHVELVLRRHGRDSGLRAATLFAQQLRDRLRGRVREACDALTDRWPFCRRALLSVASIVRSWILRIDDRCSHCTNEGLKGQKRWLQECDGLNYTSNPDYGNDQFVMTPPGGTYIADEVSNWSAHLSTYEHA